MRTIREKFEFESLIIVPLVLSCQCYADPVQSGFKHTVQSYLTRLAWLIFRGMSQSSDFFCFNMSH